MASETVTTPGSGLVFVNNYSSIPAQYESQYRNAVLAAENYFQSHFTNAITVNITFDWASLGDGDVAENEYSYVHVTYAQLRAALSSHATTADDRASVLSLPATDPSGGAGFSVPTAEAQVLGLASTKTSNSVTVTLDSNVNWQFGGDAVGALEHEISEGVMGRVAGLGTATDYANRPLWAPLDLFRYSAPNQRSFVANGSPAYFSVDGVNLATNVQFHNTNDGADLGDWAGYTGDAFGAEEPGGTSFISSTDLRELDILGWTPSASPSSSDDYANSLSDTSHPIGQVAVGGSTTGALQVTGDRDWFQVQLTAGTEYVLNETGITLNDPELRLHDASGATIATNDAIAAGNTTNAQIAFTAATTGTYYLEAGAHADNFTGQYSVGAQAVGTAAATNVAFSATVTSPSTVTSPTTVTSPSPPITTQTLASIPVYRFLDTADGGHFFTTSTTERDQVLAGRPDLRFEGVGFQSDNAAQTGAVPVYRFLDTADGGHFFTTSQTERDQVIATRPDMHFEGVGFYEDTTQQAGDTPVYRFVDAADGGHFFTASATEMAAVQATRPDLHYEGIAFYAPQT